MKEVRKTSGRFPGLIAFFKNDFKIEEWQKELNSPHEYTIINLLGAESNVEVYLVNKWIFTRRIPFIGYNIVDPNPKDNNYRELTLCEEGKYTILHLILVQSLCKHIVNIQEILVINV